MLLTSSGDLSRLFEVPIDEELEPRYNIAPTQLAPVIVQERTDPQLRMLRWGLVPSWAKDISVGSKMINARSESAFEKPAFRYAFQHRRCVIPASGFYEWREAIVPAPLSQTSLFEDAPHADKMVKQPYLFTVQDAPFGFAGLWEKWTAPDSNTVETFTILTTTPNALIGLVHDRMPCILDGADISAWLDPKVTHTEEVLSMLRPYDGSQMSERPVSRELSNPRAEGAHLLELV